MFIKKDGTESEIYRFKEPNAYPILERISVSGKPDTEIKEIGWKLARKYPGKAIICTTNDELLALDGQF